MVRGVACGWLRGGCSAVIPGATAGRIRYRKWTSSIRNLKHQPPGAWAALRQTTPRYRPTAATRVTFFDGS